MNGASYLRLKSSHDHQGDTVDDRGLQSVKTWRS
jgi:hypothetical protein